MLTGHVKYYFTLKDKLQKLPWGLVRKWPILAFVGKKAINVVIAETNIDVEG